jgi:hypothetical protein
MVKKEIMEIWNAGIMGVSNIPHFGLFRLDSIVLLKVY